MENIAQTSVASGQSFSRQGRIKLEDSWKIRLKSEFEKPYMISLKNFLAGELEKGVLIYPEPKNYFAALDKTPFDQVKVVIIGQDPYHGAGQAHGLSFSVPYGIAIPPSLINIYKEMYTDLGCRPPSFGNLEAWTKEGVLLLNAVLTVEASKPGSHKDKGWEIFTDQIIELLNRERENLAFILWGAFAQQKGARIDRQKHFVLESPHPSPFSASRGFFGSKPFSKVNQFLTSKSISPVRWNLQP